MSEDSKGLSFFNLCTIAVGATIGAGVVTLVPQAIGITGDSSWLAYMIAIIWGALTVIPFALIAATIVVKGGNYSAILRLIGPRMAGIYVCGSIIMGPHLALGWQIT